MKDSFVSNESKVSRFKLAYVIGLAMCMSVIFTFGQGFTIDVQAEGTIASPTIVANPVQPTSGNVTISSTLPQNAQSLQYRIDGVDLNGDGVMSPADGLIISKMANGQLPKDYTKADLNGDGAITGADTSMVVNSYTGWLTYTAPLTFGVNLRVDVRAVNSTNTVTYSPTASYTISNIDKVAPAAPVIPSMIRGNHPIVNGTAEPGSKVYIMDSATGEFIAPLTTSQSGQFTFVPSSNPGDVGTYNLFAYAQDAAGNYSGSRWFTVVITYDLEAPSKPQNFSMTAKTSQSATLVWTASTDNYGIDGYEVYNGSTLVGTTGAGVTSYNVSLSEGSSYSFTVKARDIGGNTSAASSPIDFVNDNIAPAAPVIPRLTQGIHPIINGTAEPGSKIYITDENTGMLVTSVTTSQSGQFTFVPPSETSDINWYSMSAYAVDAAGNYSDPTAFDYVVLSDLEPPSVPRSFNMTAKTSQSATVTWTASTDNYGIDGYEIYDGSTLVGTTGAGTTSYNVSLSEGSSYSFTVKARDIRGNTSAASSPIDFVNDNIAPAAPVIPRLTQGIHPVINGAAEPGGEIYITDENTGMLVTILTTSQSGQFTFVPPSEASDINWYSMSAYAVDAAGNYSDPTAFDYVVLGDLEPPSVPQNFSMTAKTSQSATLVWTASTDNDIIDGYEIYSGNTLVGMAGANITFYSVSLEEDSTYSFTVKARDIRRNTSAASQPIVFVNDNTPPTAPVLSISNNNWTYGPVTISLTHGMDSGSGINNSQIKIGVNGVWSTYSSPIQISADGQTNVYARTIDNVGNIGPEVSVVAQIDRIVPTIPQNLNITGKTSQAATLVWMASTDNVGLAGYEIYNGSALVGTTGGGSTSYTASLLEGVAYSFTVRAKDIAGNSSPVSQALAFINDNIAPTAPTLAISNSGWTDAPVTITVISGADSGSGVNQSQIKMGVNGAWSTYTSPFQVSAEGQTVVYARTVDNVGNMSTEASITAKIDLTAPAMPTISASGSGSTLAVVNFSGGSDAISGVQSLQYKVGVDGQWSTYTGPLNISFIGQTEVYGRSVDYVGHTSSPAGVVVRIQAPPPVDTISTPKDSDEPNNSFNTAVTMGSSKISYISQSGDADYYKWVSTKSGRQKLAFLGPNKYKLEAYSSSQSLLATTQGNATGFLYIDVVQGATYYVKVSGLTTQDYGLLAYEVQFGDVDLDMNEPYNDDRNTAPTIGYSSSQKGYISSVSDKDYYQYTVGNNPGKVEITLTMPTLANYHLRIFKTDGSQMTLEDKAAGQPEKFILSVLAGEKYYLLVENSGNTAISPDYYALQLGALQVIALEPNDTPEQAISVSPGSTYDMYAMDSADDVDYFKFTADQSGKISVYFQGPQSSANLNYDMAVFRGEGNKLKVQLQGAKIVETAQFDVQAGQVYYISIRVAPGSGFDASQKYVLKLDTISNDNESDDSVEEASQLTMGVGSTSRISISGDADYYYFDVPTAGIVQIKLDVSAVSTSKDYDIQVYNSEGKRLVRSNQNGGINELSTFQAEANSKYYVKVYGFSATDFGAETYTLTVTQP